MTGTCGDLLLSDFPAILAGDAAAVFIGPALSRAAGYPAPAILLAELGQILGLSGTLRDIAAQAQHGLHGGDRQQIQQFIQERLGIDKLLPAALGQLSRLPFRHLWTGNHDTLIERAFTAAGRSLDIITDDAQLTPKLRPGTARLYKLHGSTEHMSSLLLDDSDPELLPTVRNASLALLQAQLRRLSFLFIALERDDPALQWALRLCDRETFDPRRRHYALVQRQADQADWSAELASHGLQVIEIDSQQELADLLAQLARQVAQRRVWISGSWPEGSDEETRRIHAIAEKLGRRIAKAGLSLVSGGGQLVGTATIAGFAYTLCDAGDWSLDRRLIIRTFPQPEPGQAPDRQYWATLREELAQLSGVVIFIGGEKLRQGQQIVADGVFQELEVARRAGAFLLPIGATGGAAHTIATALLGSDLPSTGQGMLRPTDTELLILADPTLSVAQLVDAACNVLQRAMGSH
ncbi:SIR2 family protein [Azomonas macrocytogenes]|uniref:NAD(+) hydrolase ThsA Sir2/TIR-associating SLOG domain-containing protein n=1 Tax=Azomonas macrocytogenes TaxID=69962 RepID=A0A839T4B3_AZOMA|nr:SIR2 family protein [Azomonas macrocytogenes]MBB3103839.1 hypothetical protein [Azomonas macrocytogenes]